MREIFVTMGIIVVACFGILAMAWKSDSQSNVGQEPNLALQTKLSQTEADAHAPTLIADVPPPEDNGTPGQRGRG